MTVLVAVSLLVKIPLFVGFVVFLLAWVAALVVWLTRVETGLKTRSTTRFLLTMVVPLDLLSTIGLIGILGLTALFFDLGLVALLLLASALGYVLTFVAWGVLGPFDRPIGSELLWAGGRLALNERFQRINGIGSSVLFIGVLVALSYLFFTKDIPSAGATQRIFQVFLGYLAISFVLSTLPQRLAPLLSMNIDEEVRTRLFLLQLGGLFATALYISLLAWSFGIHGSDTGGPGGVGTTLSLVVVGILACVFAVTSLLPYLVGWRRARLWRRQLLQRQRANIERLAAILKAPGDRDYDEELTKLEQDVAAEHQRLIESNPVVQLAMDWETTGADALDPKYQLMFHGYCAARDHDPRLRHLEFLRKFGDEVAAIGTELNAQKRKDQRQRKAASYAGYYADERKALDDRLSEETGRNWVWAGGSLILLPVMGGILSKVGERVWAIVDSTPG